MVSRISSTRTSWRQPPPVLSVLSEGGDIGELGLELGDKLWRGDEVVALLADVGVGAGLGDEVAGTVAVRHPGLEHLRAQPLDAIGHRHLADGGDEE